MMLPATVMIPVSPWVWSAGVLLLVAFVLVVWSYRCLPQIGSAPKIAFALKVLGLLLLAACLIGPLWSGRRAKAGANLFVVLADNSGSMGIRDGDTMQSRGEILQDSLQTGRTGWLAAISESFQVRSYLFDSRLRRTADFSDLTFDGKATAFGIVLRTVAERYRGRPLAGILLMTDGGGTDTGEQSYDLSGLPPVYPVVTGRGQAPKDISVANVSVSQTSFEDAPVTVQADVEAVGLTGQTVAVELLEQAGKLVERQQWKVGQEDEKQVFRFRVRPDKTGVLFYRLRAGEEASLVGQGTNSEATPANNERAVVVSRGKGPYRILYVAGRPNWDLKFLKRAVEQDEQVQLVVLLRVARREPKYDWRGHAGETTNPLYRGFDPEDKERVEEYDQPVLVRLNTRDQAELRDGFPKTCEELFAYGAIILDDVEAGFFTHEQMDLIRRFVAERGGAFLMLGGKESFQKGNFQRTPVGGILPVYLDPVSPSDAAPSARWELTREGWLQPWARLRDKETDEQQRLAAMPDFRVLNRIRAVKPGAGVIATVGTGQGQSSPALVVQRLGNGRTAALTIGDTWRWALQKPETHEDMNKFWRQVVRWLVADVPGRISLQATSKADATNQPVVLQVRVRNEAFEPLDNVSVAVEVHEPDGRSVALTATPVSAESGLFEAAYVPRLSGGYCAQATVAGAEGTKLGDAEAGWAVDLEAREFGSIKANRPLLETIARQTGGRLLEAGELDSFARSLPRRNAPVTEVWVRPLWDLPGIRPVLFLLALVCFIGEWAIRRWRGMP